MSSERENGSSLAPLVLKSHHKDSRKITRLDIPVINGGMGVGVSGPTLASAITNEGGGGVLTGVALGHPFKEILGRRKEILDPYEANRLALAEWIRDAKEKARGGFVGVNLMVAVHDFKELAVTAARNGVDLIVAGAGLPMGLPDVVRSFPDTMIAPIISSAKAAKIMIRRWLGKGRAPDAIIFESIHHSGGHQGGSVDEIQRGANRPEESIGATRELMDHFDLGSTPLIAAGGVWSRSDILKVISWGAQGVQMASRFLLTDEAGAEFGGIPLFKRLFIENKKTTPLVRSPAGFPGRAIATPFSERFAYSKPTVDKEPHDCPARCLVSCAKTKSIYCILDHLTLALKNDFEKGLFFAGSNIGRAGRKKEILSVKELMNRLKIGEPVSASAALAAREA